MKDLIKNPWMIILTLLLALTTFTVYIFAGELCDIESMSEFISSAGNLIKNSAEAITAFASVPMLAWALKRISRNKTLLDNHLRHSGEDISKINKSIDTIKLNSVRFERRLVKIEKKIDDIDQNVSTFPGLNNGGKQNGS